MPEAFREEFAPDGDLPAAHPDHTELSSSRLLSLETDLTLGAPVPEHLAARAARLEADQRLVDILRGDGFEGPRYERAAEGWWSYGWRTMVKWTGTGEVFRRSRLAGRPVAKDMITTAWSQDDRHQVATESVIGGIKLFRERGLIQGGWRPQGGASLTTYVVGAAILAFRPAYNAWFRDRQMGQAELDTGADDVPQHDIPDQRATDPCHTAAVHDELARLLPHITDPQVLEALGWRALGYSQAEAAERVGLTEKALEHRTSRTRRRIRDTYLRQPELGEGQAR
ncbi:hypothetical protein ABZ733_33955 [Streptomyces longwoodensis]|uniref:hypothetical protein n=1 Tax=Streptomyces longwoodensis TaxID=68231 RepID=UPI0033F96728